MFRNIITFLISFFFCISVQAQPSAVYSDCADINGCVPNAITASSSSALTNKTFNADGTGNSITNIENENVKAGAAISLDKLASLTVSRALVSDASGFIVVSSTTAAEIGYLSGVTSSIQSQINSLGSAAAGWTRSGTNVYATTSTDNVGIGTFNPTQKLQVAGTVKATAFIGDGSALSGLPSGNITINTTSPVTGAGTGTTFTFGVDESKLTLSNIGGAVTDAQVPNNITITEADPQVGTLTNTKWCTTDGTAVNCQQDAPTGSGSVNSGGADYVAIYDTAGTAVSASSVLSDNGTNIGIGTVGPVSKLQVVGTIAATAFIGNGANVSNVNAITGDSATAFFSTGAIERAIGGTGADTSAFGSGIIGSNSSNVTIDIDTVSEIETAVGNQNLLIETEIDASSELRGLMDDESGTGALIFADGDIGTATATTPAEDDNDTSVATTAYVQTEISGLGSGAWINGGTNVYVSPTTDNVGIGTTTPTTKLTVAGTTTTTAGVISGTGGAGFQDYVAQSSDPATPSAGYTRLFSSTNNGFTRVSHLNELGVPLVMGRDVSFVVRNTTGSTLTKGSVVYVSGSSGNVPLVTLARANSLTTLPSLGIVMANISNNSFGYVMTGGILDGVDTSAYTSGDQLYVSGTTAGAIQNTRPTFPLYANRIGTVLVSGVNGSIEVKVAPFLGGQESGTVAANYMFSGNVGVGTFSPSGSVEVVKSGSLAPLMVSATATGDGNYLIVSSSGNVGIGTTVPGSVFHVGTGAIRLGTGTSGSTLTTAISNGITYTFNGTYDFNNRIFHNFVTSGHGGESGNQTTGLKSTTSSYQTGSGSFVRAIHGEATTVHPSGTTDNVYGVYGNTVRNGAGGTVTNSYGIYGASGTVTAGTVTNNFALGASGRSVFSGNVGIGSALTDPYVLIAPGTGGLNVSGNVGVGTWYPQQKLQVVGTISATSFVGDGSALTGVGSSGWVDGGTNIYASPTTDNVAIGTTTPTQKLTVVGTVSATAFVGDGSGLTGLPSGGGWSDGGTNVYTSTTTDTVGIGTTTPSTTLEIVKQGSSAPLMVSSTATGDGNIMIITSAGNVGIGTLLPRGSLDLGPTGTLYAQTFTGPTGPTILGTSNNVGIGTITAGSLLTVGSTGQVTVSSAGAVATSSTVSVADDAYAAGWNGSTNVPTKNAVYDKIETIGASAWTDGGTNIYSSPTTDNVGIGTTTPKSGIKLDVRGDSYFSGNVGIGTSTDLNQVLTVQGALATQGASGVTYFNATGGNVGIGTTSPVGGLVIINGNVGVGTFSPTALFEVKGAVRVGIGTITPGTLTCFKSITGGQATIGYCTGSLTNSICGTCN